MAMSGDPGSLCYVQGGLGSASSVKMVNQLLAGAHIAVAAEAMAFSARLGLPSQSVFEILKNSAAWSWMFENRVPHMINEDWTPYSSLEIFVKDLGIVLDEARILKAFVPVTAIAHTLYVSGAAHGLAKESDAGLIRLWQTMAGTPTGSDA